MDHGGPDGVRVKPVAFREDGVALLTSAQAKLLAVAHNAAPTREGQLARDEAYYLTRVVCERWPDLYSRDQAVPAALALWVERNVDVVVAVEAPLFMPGELRWVQNVAEARERAME